MAAHVDGKVTPLGEPVYFDAVPLDNATLPAKDRAGVLAFQRKTARLQRAVHGAIQVAGEARTRIASLQKVLIETPKTCREAYEIAGTEFAATLAKLRTLIGTDLVRLDAEAEAAGAPWTPGRLPEWKME